MESITKDSHCIMDTFCVKKSDLTRIPKNETIKVVFYALVAVYFLLRKSGTCASFFVKQV